MGLSGRVGREPKRKRTTNATLLEDREAGPRARQCTRAMAADQAEERVARRKRIAWDAAYKVVFPTPPPPPAPCSSLSSCFFSTPSLQSVTRRMSSISAISFCTALLLLGRKPRRLRAPQPCQYLLEVQSKKHGCGARTRRSLVATNSLR
eukprot:9488777-Pyramimonas_sp.AAC.2